MKIKLLVRLILLLTMFKTNAQIVITNPGRVAENSVQNRANNKVYQGVDKGLDKIEEGIGNLFKKKKKEEKPAENPQNPNQQSDNQGINNANENNGAKIKKPSLQTYSKFDFMPGEKVIVQEDFSQDELGDFPAKWNTNSTGELVNVEGTKGKWLSLTKDGAFLPEFITALPENFTFEFDLLTNTEFSFYSTTFNVIMANLPTTKDFTKWGRFKHDPVSGIEVNFHPTNAGSSQGRTGYNIYEKDNQSEMKMKLIRVSFLRK